MRATAILRLAALAALASSLVLPAKTATPRVFGGPAAAARPEDIPYIRCQVCEALARTAWQTAADLLAKGTLGNPVHEDKLIDAMEHITTSWRPEGEWISNIDLVEEGDRLVVKEMDQLGVCGVECKTVERAAERIMGEHDTDIAEALFVGKRSREQFVEWMCKELTEACSKPPPPLPKDRAPGPAFEPRQEGDRNFDAMIGGLEEQGVVGPKVRDELMQKLGMETEGGQASVDAALKAAMEQAEAEAAAKGSPAADGTPPEEDDEYEDPEL